MSVPPDPPRRSYWGRNLRFLGVLLTLWFAVSFGCGILLVDVLDRWNLPGTGFPLGFWFAQQGAILVFVVLVFVYTRLMNRLDDEFTEGEEEPADAEADDRGAGAER